jgi:hypothetical protein
MVVHESGGGGDNLGLAGARRGREVTASRRTEGSAKVCFLLAALRWVDHQADDTPLLHGDVDDNIEDIYRDLRRVRSVRCCGEMGGTPDGRAALTFGIECWACGCGSCSFYAKSMLLVAVAFFPSRAHANNNTSIPVQRLYLHDATLRAP